MPHSRHSLFKNTATPGEYGTAAHPKGWIVITHPALGKQRIFVSAKAFREPLSKKYQIPESNIVSLIDNQPDSPHGIPEEILDGKTGLQLFQNRLQKIQATNNDVIIHCLIGINRSPVAAVIYLISKGLSPDEAAATVSDAFKQQRNEKFILNKFGHYTEVLNSAAQAYEKSNALAMI